MPRKSIYYFMSHTYSRERNQFKNTKSSNSKLHHAAHPNRETKCVVKMSFSNLPYGFYGCLSISHGSRLLNSSPTRGLHYDDVVIST